METNFAALFLFWAIVLATVASAAFVVAARNILHAAFSLAVTLLGVSGLYLFLHADFVAAVQLIVYVGGILVLIMFAIMFSSHTQGGTLEVGRSWKLIGFGGAIALVILGCLIRMLEFLRGPLAAANAQSLEGYQHTINVESGREGLGHLLMAQYLLPFEVASILILAALIGAVVIVRKETR